MYKLLLTDLDGTLINNNGELPPVNIQYIKKIMNKGINVALCSGRSFVSLARFEKEIGLNIPGCYGVCFNGGIVYNAHTKEILKETRLNLQTTLDILKEIKTAMGNNPVGIGLYLAGKFYVENPSEEITWYANKSGIEYIQVDHFAQINQDITKILLKGNNEHLKVIANHLINIINGKGVAFFSTPNIFEIIPLNSGKEQGLAFLSQKLNIPTTQIIAVGDQENDLKMIQMAGLGIAVANAITDVKKVAKYITKADNNQGVMKEIAEKFFL